MTDAKKTSTFTIHHDHCKPETWSLAQWKLLQDFIKEPSLQRAAALSRLGIRLVLSEHHEPVGGTLESFGWTAESQMPFPDTISDRMDDVADDDDITPVVELYRGPTKYAVRYAIGDADGNFEGHEHEIKDTEAEAEEFLKSLQEETETA